MDVPGIRLSDADIRAAVASIMENSR